MDEKDIIADCLNETLEKFKNKQVTITYWERKYVGSMICTAVEKAIEKLKGD